MGFRLREEAGDAQRLRTADLEDLREVVDRRAGIDNVFDEQDVLAFDVFGQIVLDPNLSGRMHALITRYADELDFAVEIDGAREVTQEYERALQNSDERQLLTSVITADLCAERFDSCIKLGGVDEGAHL